MRARGAVGVTGAHMVSKSPIAETRTNSSSTVSLDKAAEGAVAAGAAVVEVAGAASLAEEVAGAASLTIDTPKASRTGCSHNSEMVQNFSRYTPSYEGATRVSSLK